MPEPLIIELRVKRGERVILNYPMSPRVGYFRWQATPDGVIVGDGYDLNGISLFTDYSVHNIPRPQVTFEPVSDDDGSEENNEASD